MRRMSWRDTNMPDEEGMVPEGEITPETPEEVQEGLSADGGPTSEPAHMEQGPSRGLKLAAIAVGLMIVLAAAAAIIVLSFADLEEGGDNVPQDSIKVTLDAETFGFVGTPFRFSVDVSGNKGEPNVTWDFGDGLFGSGRETFHTYGVHGTFALKVTVAVDGRTVQRSATIEVRPVNVPDDILPPGNRPEWVVQFSGVPSMTELTVLGMTEPRDLMKTINITLGGVERTFIGIRFLDVLDLMSVRSDAEGFRVVGGTTFEGKVHSIMMEENSGGNASYLVFVEGGEWLNDTSYSTPLMFLGPEPELGDIVKDVSRIETEPLEMLFKGPGLKASESLSFEEMFARVQYKNFTVSSGMSTDTWIGFPLWDILESTGVLRNATEVVVGASDGYDVMFDIMDVWDNPESDMPFSYRLITPDSDHTEDDGHNWFSQSWVKQVSRVTVEASDTPAPPLPWGGPLPGALTITWNGGSRTFSTLELSIMWDDLLEMDATLVKSTGNTTNGTYAGIRVFDLVEAAGCPVVPGMFRFIAGDGFSYTADAMELSYRESEEMNATIIALTENGEFITGPKGPLRVVSSALPSKGWVGNLTDIEVVEWSLELDGSILNLSDILALPAITVPVSSKGVITNYTGIDLVDLGVGRGVGSITIFGYDSFDGIVNATGYSQVIDLVQFAGRPAGERPFLAYMREGERLPLSEKGPVRLIAPGLSSNYWVGSVKSISVDHHVLMLRNGSIYANLTLAAIMGLGYVIEGGNASAVNSTGAVNNITFTGVKVLDLLEQAFGPSFKGNLTLTLAGGEVLNMNWTELTGPNRTAYIAWDLEGQELSLWNGLFALVLSDTTAGGPDDWTYGMWRYYVVSVEVSP